MLEGGATHFGDSQRTPLILAAQTNFEPSVINSLLQDGADLSAVDEDGLGALENALIYNNESAAETLLFWDADINRTSSDGYTPLLYYLEYSPSPKGLAFVLDYGADVQRRTHDGYTPLMLAARNRLPLELFILLVEAGADLKARDTHGRTTLMHALENTNDEEAITYLIDVGSSLSAQDENGKDPLTYAAIYSDDPMMIDLLLDAGANGWNSDYDGLSAFEYAKENPSLAYTQQYWRLNDERFTDWDW